MKQLLTRLRWQFLLTGFLLLTVLLPAAAETVTIGDYTYSLYLNPEDKTAIIADRNTPIQGSTYKIPSTVTVGETTYTITEIHTLNLPDLEEFTIPASISQIGAMRTGNIKNIIFEDSETSISFTGAWITVSESLYLGRDISQYAMISYSGCANSVTIGECVNSFSWETIPSTKELIIKDSDKSILYSSNPYDRDWKTEKVYIGRNIEYPESSRDELSPFKNMETLTDVAFSDNVTELPTNLFEFCTGITEITLPSSLKKMGWRVFGSCSNLNKVVLPKGLTEIPNFTFSECTSLSEINLPSTLKIIGDMAFGSCISLASVTLPEGLTEIGKTAFYNCNRIQSISIPASVSTIGEQIFDSCSALENIDLPEGLEMITNMMFYNCRSLKEISIPTSVKSVGRGAFYRCQGLQRVDFNGSEPTIGDNAFMECYTLKEFTFPSGSASIGECIFENCSQIKKIVLPTSITSIPYNAFAGCNLLTDITIPECVTEIMDNAFYNCSALEEITIPGNVETIYSGAFEGCTNLKKIIFADSDKLIYIYNDAFGVSPIETFHLGRNISTNGHIDISNAKIISIGNSVTEIPSRCFAGCENLETFIVPENVERIGNEAFSGCKNLKSIVLPNKLEYIAGALFRGCENLASINIPAGAVEVLYNAFEGCSKLEEITFPALTDWIDEEAFAGCTSLKRIRVMNPEPFKIYDNSFDKDTYATASLEVPAGTESAYAAADVWYKFLNLKEFTPPTLEIAETQVTVGVDNEITVTPIVKDAGEETFTFSFVSEDTEIAAITDDGKIRGVSAGRTKIFVLANGSKGTGLTTDFILTVTPKTGVEDIDAEDEIVTVFSMDGVECFRGNRSEIENRLSKGLYIVVGNGKATKKKL